MFLPYVASVAMAEPRAMKEGLALANRLGVSVVVAESDSLETVEACTGDETWWNESVRRLCRFNCNDLLSLFYSLSKGRK